MTHTHDHPHPHRAARKHIDELKSKAKKYADLAAEHATLSHYYFHLHDETQGAIATLEEALS